MTLPEDIAQAVANIKPLSQSAGRLMELLTDPDHNVADVVSIVESDAALTTQVLKTVNSAAFALRGPVETIAKAVSYLGDKTVAGMALGGCAAEVYGASLDGYEGQRGALWRSGLLCAISAREIARCSNGKASPEVAYTAGILHDIGKSVISEWLEGKSREMVSKADSSATDYITLEQEVTGTNHCQVGFALAKRWKLPDVLCEAIAYHHHPQEASEKFRATVYAVHLGDMLAMMRGTDTGADGMRYKIDEKYRDYITISINELERISFQAGLEFKKISDSLYGESGGE